MVPVSKILTISHKNPYTERFIFVHYSFFKYHNAIYICQMYYNPAKIIYCAFLNISNWTFELGQCSRNDMNILLIMCHNCHYFCKNHTWGVCRLLTGFLTNLLLSHVIISLLLSASFCHRSVAVCIFLTNQFVDWLVLS